MVIRQTPVSNNTESSQNDIIQTLIPKFKAMSLLKIEFNFFLV